MKNKLKAGTIALIVLVALGSLGVYLSHSNIQVFNSKGPIASQERDLIYLALGLSAIVVIPVYVMTIVIVYKYREGKNGEYSPNLVGSWKAETTWWLIPTVIITILAVVTWQSSHTLDPYRTIASGVTPINIEVVALDWKWLFIYPEQNIATVNYFELPVNTPVNFQITADAPMNSFWIPQLGGQIYAMPGMNTQLHLLASTPGSYYGSSSNISGSGFASMNFRAYATSNDNFLTWVGNIKNTPESLTPGTYDKLSQPSTSFPTSNYVLGDPNLYLTIIDKYMLPSSSVSGGSHNLNVSSSSSGMEM